MSEFNTDPQSDDTGTDLTGSSKAQKILSLLRNQDTMEQGLEILKTLDKLDLVEEILDTVEYWRLYVKKNVTFYSSQYFLFELLQTWPEVRQLTGNPFQPERLTFREISIRSLPDLPPGLIKLSLQRMNELTGFSALKSLNHLEILELKDLAIRKLPDIPPSVKTLKLAHINQCSDFSILPSFTHLKKLTFNGMTFKTLPPVPPSLNELILDDVYYCTDFSSAFHIPGLKVSGSSLTQYQHNLAEWYGDQNEPEKAVEVYREILDRNPGDLAAWNNMGNDLKTLERYEEALAAYLKTIEIRPDYPQVFRFYHNIGRVYYRTGDLKNTILWWEKSRDKNPDFTGARLDLAEALIADRNPEKALEEISVIRSLKIKPEEEWICYYLQAIALKLISGRENEQLKAEGLFKRSSGKYTSTMNFTADNIYRYFTGDQVMTDYIRELAVYLK